MQEIILNVIPEPEEGSVAVFRPTSDYGERPLIIGQGTGTKKYLCGSCNFAVIDNIGDNLVMDNIVLQCPKCALTEALTEAIDDWIKRETVIKKDREKNVK